MVRMYLIICTCSTYGKKIDETHYKDNDPGSNDKAPKRETNALLACRMFVEISKNAVAERNHGDS